MEKIKSVAVLGAGAMGAYFATRFFASEAIDITLVARDQRYQRLQNQGLMVNGKHYAVPVIQPDAVAAPVDLIIVALKHHHLAEALVDLKNLVGDGTVIISVMNGLDSEEIIGSVYGMDKLLYAVSVGIDALREGNQVVFSKPGIHYFGEAVNENLSPRVQRIQEAFKAVDIAYETPEDMIRIMWWKFMINVGMNQSSAVMRAPYGVYQSSLKAQAVMKALMAEVITLAQAAGVNLVEQDVSDWYTFLNSLSAQGKTSMLQDIEAHRKTEVEIFGGKVVALGQHYGIPTPVNETLMNIISVLEQ